MLLEQPWPWLIGVALAASLAWITASDLGGNLALIAPAAGLVASGVGYVFWQAAQRRRWALLTILSTVLFLLDIVFRTREVGEPGLDVQNGLKLLAWIGMLAVCAINLSQIRRYLADPALLAFASYCAICLVSTVYSAVPLITSTAAFGMLAYMLFACLVVEELPEPLIYKTLFWVFTAFCLVNLASVLMIPDVAFYHVDPSTPDVVRLQGVSGHPNQLGRATSVFLMLIAIVAWFRYVRPIWWVPMTIVGLVLALWSESRTSVFGVILALIMLLPRNILLLLGAFMLCVAGSILASGQLDAILTLIGRNGSADEALSMSGRADLWEFTWRLIQDRPLTGYGFNSFESLAGTYWSGRANAALVATHNNYLSVWFSTGLFGLSAFLAGFGVLLYRWLVHPAFARDLFVLNALFESFSESDILSLIAPMATLVFMIIIALDTRRQP